MGQERPHKQCVMDVANLVKKTHSTYKEYPINRLGDYHYLDLIGHPLSEEVNFKPFALECESGSSKSQQESNKLDLQEFKKRFPESEIFQINNANEFDINKLKKINNGMVKKPIRGF